MKPRYPDAQSFLNKPLGPSSFLVWQDLRPLPLAWWKVSALLAMLTCSPGNRGYLSPGQGSLQQGIHRVPTQESNLSLLTSPALAGKFFIISAAWEAQFYS